MKKLLLTILMIAISAFLMAGCGGSQSVTIVGSTSVQPLAETLAEKYQNDNRGVNVNVQGGGSSAGIKAALDGTADIGTSSRPLSAEEEKEGLTGTEIAIDGIAIAVQPGNPVNQLTMDQLKKIFSGEIVNWKDVGGPDKAVVIVNREEGSGTRGAFTELVMGKTPLAAKSLVQGSTGAVRQTVANNPAAIGYISLAAADKSVKLVAINGISCNVASVKEKKYPILRPFLFVTKKGKMSEPVKKFVDYVLGEGQAVVTENGYVSVK